MGVLVGLLWNPLRSKGCLSGSAQESLVNIFGQIWSSGAFFECCKGKEGSQASAMENR